MSPFRYGNHGVVPGAQRGAIWTCPTCGAENTGPLESGCSKCRAGADAQKVLVKAPPVRIADDPKALLAFDQWYTGPVGQQVIQWEAFQAGAAWKEKEMLAVLHQDLSLRVEAPRPDGPSTGGTRLGLIFPEEGSMTEVDVRTHATVVAALQFYVENTLAYGDMPGQLSVAEAKTLIAQLLPKEEVPQI